MPRNLIGYAYILLLFTLSYSCQTGGSRFGEIKPVSEICVESYDVNRLPLEISEMNSDPDEVTIRYRFVSQNCLCDSNPIFVCERPANWTVKMNGEEILPSKRQHMFDETDGCYVIGGRVLDGENVIELQGNGEISRACIAGDFNVLASDETEWLVAPSKTLKVAPLSGQGMPFYSGEVSYSRKYEAPETIGRRVLRITEWEGESCAVWVNGAKVANFAGKTLKKNIGPFLKTGENDIAIVVTVSEGDAGLLSEFTIE